MGYASFSNGDTVRIASGEFRGIVGTILPPTKPADCTPTVILSSTGNSMPVTISARIDGCTLRLRIPPELLEFCPWTAADKKEREATF